MESCFHIGLTKICLWNFKLKMIQIKYLALYMFGGIINVYALLYGHESRKIEEAGISHWWTYLWQFLCAHDFCAVKCSIKQKKSPRGLVKRPKKVCSGGSNCSKSREAKYCKISNQYRQALAKSRVCESFLESCIIYFSKSKNLFVIVFSSVQFLSLRVIVKD